MTKVKWRKWFFRTILAIIAAIALFVVVFVGIVLLTPFDASKLTRSSEPSVVYAQDGSVYMKIASQGANDLSYNQIPKNLRNAIVAVEDHNYWTNTGVDFKGMMRAAFIDLWSRSYAQGASTLEMQLAKIVYLNDKKTVGRKLNQVVLGLQINRHFTKQEILAMYLNRVYLGENTIGVKEAAMRYYGIDIEKHPEKLTLDEAALLAGLAQAPSAYDPIQHPDLAERRRNIVLAQMAKYGYISEAQAKQAEAKPVGKLTYHNLPDDAWDTHPLFANFLFDYAQKDAKINPEELLQGGLKIYTTIDPKVQSAVDKVFWSTNYNGDFPGPTSGNVVQGAALFMDPKTGGILGAAGSRKQGFAYLGLDRVYSLQQPGSSIKPVLEYGAAIESGKWGPNSIVNNQRQDFGGGYAPRNDDPSAPAKMTLRDALAHSENVAAVWLLQQVGVNNAVNFAEKLGIDFKNRSLGIALGNIEPGVNTLEMAQAYSAFANNGKQMDAHLITKIQNRTGDTIYSFEPGGKTVMKPSTAATMTSLLQSVVSYGTGTAAQVPGWGVAGKTGTVQYSSQLSGPHQDWVRTGWFDGYTPTMVGSIYLAYDQSDDQHHMTGIASHYAAKIWGDIVKLATAGQAPRQFGSTTPSQPVQQNQPPLSNLQAAWDPSLNAVRLTWDSPQKGKVNFIIKRAGPFAQPQNGNTGDFTPLGQTSQTVFVDPDAQPGMSYTYMVQAVDASGNPLQPALTLGVTLQPDSQQPPGGTDNQTGNPGGGPGNETGGPTPPTNDTGGPGGGQGGGPMPPAPPLPGNPPGTKPTNPPGNQTGGQ